MKEKPILFSSEMVRAILDGRKNQTRRVIKTQPSERPYGQVGDVLWVRETFAPYYDGMGSGERDSRVFYRADYNDGKPPISSLKWKPSIFMPRLASRIHLRITEIRVERLQDISRGDAMAEGCPFPNIAGGENPINWFSSLWQSINGKESWNANPWVWVIEFEKLQGEKT